MKGKFQHSGDLFARGKQLILVLTKVARGPHKLRLHVAVRFGAGADGKTALRADDIGY